MNQRTGLLYYLRKATSNLTQLFMLSLQLCQGTALWSAWPGRQVGGKAIAIPPAVSAQKPPPPAPGYRRVIQEKYPTLRSGHKEGVGGYSRSFSLTYCTTKSSVLF